MKKRRMAYDDPSGSSSTGAPDSIDRHCDTSYLDSWFCGFRHSEWDRGEEQL